MGEPAHNKRKVKPDVRRVELPWHPWRCCRATTELSPLNLRSDSSQDTTRYEIRCCPRRPTRFGPYKHLSGLPSSAAVFRRLATFKTLT